MRGERSRRSKSHENGSLADLEQKVRDLRAIVAILESNLEELAGKKEDSV